MRGGAQNVGIVIPQEDPTEHVRGIEAAIARDNASFPELIFFTEAELPETKDLILAEGLSRATAYVCGGEPDSVDALVGLTSLAGWPFR